MEKRTAFNCKQYRRITNPLHPGKAGLIQPGEKMKIAKVISLKIQVVFSSINGDCYGYIEHNTTSNIHTYRFVSDKTVVYFNSTDDYHVRNKMHAILPIK